MMGNTFKAVMRYAGNYKWFFSRLYTHDKSLFSTTKNIKPKSADLINSDDQIHQGFYLFNNSAKHLQDWIEWLVKLWYCKCWLETFVQHVENTVNSAYKELIGTMTMCSL